MINSKKFEVAFKRYINNFVEGIKFEDVKEKYNISRSKIEKIIDQNDTEKDHILLINLSKIFSYYLSLWKKNVLIDHILR